MEIFKLEYKLIAISQFLHSNNFVGKCYLLTNILICLILFWIVYSIQLILFSYFGIQELQINTWKTQSRNV